MVAQVGVSVALVATSLLVMRSLAATRSFDLGFDTRGLIVAEPYRSYAGRVRARFGPWREARFPTAPGRSLYAPSRWGRSEPLDPRRSVKAYEAGLRRRAEALGLERPAVISSHPFLVGLGDLDWAGPATYYGWDDWLASEPHRAWWPAYEAAFAGMRERRTRVCGVTPAVVELESARNPLLSYEVPFACVWVAPFEWGAVDVLDDSLVLSLHTDDMAVVAEAAELAAVSNVYRGKPTSWLHPDVPHDGFLGEFLMRAKGLAHGDR